MIGRIALFLVFALCWPLQASPAAPLSDKDRKEYDAAFRAALSDKWKAAWRHAGRTTDPLPKKVLDWMSMIDRSGGRGFADIAAFATANPHWPRLDRLEIRVEEEMSDQTEATDILAWYEHRPPKTWNGVRQFARALTEGGEFARLEAMLRTAWVERNFSARDEHNFRKTFRQHLTQEDNIRRLDRLLWEGKTAAASRQARRVPAEVRYLAEARIALRRSSGGVDRAIAKVPSHLQNDPGLIYERVRWRRRKGREDGAVDLLLQNQIDPGEWADTWWRERGILARNALEDGKISIAYRLAAEHGAKKGFPFAEGEWLAGWIALRFLKDPLMAFPHFRRMYGNVSFPVSLSRAAYWAGRAAEEAGKIKIAAQWYATAARHGSSFYGQMAAAHLPKADRPPMPKEPRPVEAERNAFNNRDLVQLARILPVFDLDLFVRRAIRHMAKQAEGAVEFALLAELAAETGRPHDAVYVSRQAIKKQVVLTETGYPVLRLDKGLGIGPDVVFGLIRQESAFERTVVSSAGARGFMQLMPATAKAVAARHKLLYRKEQLTGDYHYNVTLGSAYLKGLIDRFDGSLILALASYNAGPHRARKWMKAFGDPRTNVREALDWMEMIPFTETRNYVQRVLENITVYRGKLTGKPSLLSFSSLTVPVVTKDVWTSPPRAPRRSATRAKS